jgi:hypothetical protein
MPPTAAAAASCDHCYTHASGRESSGTPLLQRLLHHATTATLMQVVASLQVLHILVPKCGADVL